MGKDDYTRLAETLDDQFSDASIRIDNSGQTKTLVVDMYNSDTDIAAVRDWITNTDNRRAVFGYAENQLTFRTEPEGSNKLLVAIEDNS